MQCSQYRPPFSSLEGVPGKNLSPQEGEALAVAQGPTSCAAQHLPQERRKRGRVWPLNLRADGRLPQDLLRTNKPLTSKASTPCHTECVSLRGRSHNATLVLAYNAP